ncbi:MAG: hypothetical protein N2045_14060, partial [Fimbriimonadales bacterium]|nr:hypothetical protein [Fimbriimonadales bacterium]
MEDAKRAGLIGKAGGNWEKYPRAMLRARVVSEGVRTVFPGVIVGLYTPEEVRDFEPVPAIKADAEPSLEPVEEPKPRNTGEALRELARVHAAHWQPPNEDSAEPAPEPTSEFDPPASLPATQPSAPKEPITKQQIIEISERFRKLGLEHESFRAHKAALMRAITGKDYKSRKELSRSEAEAVMRGLDQLMQIIRLSEVQEFCEALDAEILEGTYSSEHGWNALLEDYRAIKEEEQ